MKVLLCNSFLHARGGDTTCLFAQWRGLEARGHTVIPFAMRHPANDPSPWEVRFPPWLDVTGERGARRALAALRAVHSLRAARAIAALVEDVRPDVAHLHHVHRHLTPAILGPLRAAGVPVVWTLHDYELVCPNGTLYTAGAECRRCLGHRYENAVRHRCKRGRLAESAAVALEKWVHARQGVWERVDRFLCPSAYLARTLVAFGIEPGRVEVLPNPVAPRAAGGPIGEGWVYAGRLAPEKGVDVAIAAARLLPERRLDIYGDGPERAVLERTAPPNVRFHGAVSAAVLGDALGRAGVVAVPSRWPENLPYAVFEGQLAARAVVASRVGGVPEQIANGEDGLLVPAGDAAALAAAVGALLEDPTRAAALGAAGRARVLREGSVERHVARLEAVYRAVGAP